MVHFRPVPLRFLLVLSVGACEPAPPPDTAVRTDSAGVVLVEYPDLPPTASSRIAIASEPDLVLGDGGAFSGPDHEFYQIRGVSQLRDGTLIVANQGSRELRFYGADGPFLRSAGREGDGPGEFQLLSNLWTVAGDTVVVWDYRARRLQHFSPDGAFVRGTAIITTPFREFSSMPPQAQAILEHGRVGVFLESRSPGVGSHGAPERQPLLVTLHRIDDGGWDSVRVVPGTEQVHGPQGESYNYQFGAYTVGAGAGEIMAVADVARFRVELFDPDGRLVSILSAPVPEVPVTADVIEAQVAHMVDWVASPDPDAYAEMLRGAYSARHRPFLPAIRDVFVDADERIWVERYDVPGAGPSRWEVFAPDGSWIGRVEMPDGFARGLSDGRSAPGFSIRSGRLAGVWRDPDTGVETVRVYRVIEEAS